VSRSRRAWVGVVVAGALLLTGAVAAGHLLAPRTDGVEGDWAARSLPGTVVAGRALVSGANVALDLRSGTRVTLGSVTGGTPYVADERLVIAGPGRVDSVRLDATARWTWRAPAGATVVPLAADAGSTMVATCAGTGAKACRLVGLDLRGHESWRSEAPTGRPETPGSGALPRAHAEAVTGGGLLVTDPATGRQVLVPGSTFLAVPDGPVVVPVEQGGQCVVSATSGGDPVWTRVLGPCPGGKLPRLTATATGTAVRLDWPGTSRALDLATGSDTATTAPKRPGELARTADLVAAGRELTSHTDLLHWGEPLHAIEFRGAAQGVGAEPVARIVSRHRLDLLLLEPRAVVVRDGDQVVRYTLDRASATLEP
jgi:hypothetical protein